MDKLKYLEMQLNKKDLLLEKAKLICVKLDKIFLIVPYTVSRIEQRMRNVMINNRHILDGISHFMNFYLINLQFKVHIQNRYKLHLEEQSHIKYEAKFNKKKHLANYNS